MKSDGIDKVENVLAIFKACNIDTWAEQTKSTYLKKAFEHLESIAVTSDRKKPLIELANYLMNRNGNNMILFYFLTLSLLEEWKIHV